MFLAFNRINSWDDNHINNECTKRISNGVVSYIQCQHLSFILDYVQYKTRNSHFLQYLGKAYKKKKKFFVNPFIQFIFASNFLSI